MRIKTFDNRNTTVIIINNFYDEVVKMFTKANKPFEAKKSPSKESALKIFVTLFTELINEGTLGYKIKYNSNFGTLFYNGNYWLQIPDEIIQSTITKCFEYYFSDNFYFPLRLCKEVQHTIGMKYNYTFVQSKGLNFKDCSLILNEQTNMFEKQKHSYEHYFMYTLPCNYNENAYVKFENSRFKDFLNSVLPPETDGNVNHQNIIAEYICNAFFGYHLDLMLVLYGKGANGKSTLLEILAHAIGKYNVSYVSLSTLTDSEDSFSRVNIVNKILNISNETDTIKNPMTFKTIASKEPLGINIKYKDRLETTNYATTICAFNEIPYINDKSNASDRRWVVVPFNKRFLSNEQDTTIATKIINDELDIVISWVLHNGGNFLNRLRNDPKAKYTTNYTIQNITELFKYDNDKERKFMSMRYRPTAKGGMERIKINIVHERYKEFMRDEYENSKPLEKKSFKDKLNTIGYICEYDSKHKITYCYVAEIEENVFDEVGF